MGGPVQHLLQAAVPVAGEATTKNVLRCQPGEQQSSKSSACGFSGYNFGNNL